MEKKVNRFNEDLEKVAKELKIELCQTYFDYAKNDTAANQRLVFRDRFYVGVLVADGECIDYMQGSEARELAAAISKAADDAARLLKAWGKARKAKGKQ